jgi:hypothetical protein
MVRRMKTVVLLFCLALSASAALTEADLDAVGRRVWQNECAGSREGLTSWNTGENFASLGIGHFIWYPAGVKGPFEESFPKLVRFFMDHGAKVPAWLRDQPPCPWKTREEFQREFQGERMQGLRELLASTIRLQSQFLAKRMQESLPSMLTKASPDRRNQVRKNFESLLATGAGTFALIDYVNFKGEGVSPTERYQGQGWGLLQVLESMRREGGGIAAFSEAAAEVLERRVRLAPPERGETRWLSGWKARVRAYAR